MLQVVVRHTCKTIAADKDCIDVEESPLTLVLFLQAPSGMIQQNMSTGVFYIDYASVSNCIKYSFHV